MERRETLLRRSLWIWSLMFWHEFSWRHGCGNSPSVISLRASPAVAGFHRGRNSLRSLGSRYVVSRLLDPSSLREFAFQSGQFDAVLNLRDWRGGLLLRCSSWWSNSPASCCGPVCGCGISLATAHIRRYGCACSSSVTGREGRWSKYGYRTHLVHRRLGDRCRGGCRCCHRAHHHGETPVPRL